jgi:hypothetical protein
VGLERRQELHRAYSDQPVPVLSLLPMPESDAFADGAYRGRMSVTAVLALRDRGWWRPRQVRGGALATGGPPQATRRWAGCRGRGRDVPSMVVGRGCALGGLSGVGSALGRRRGYFAWGEDDGGGFFFVGRGTAISREG